MQIFEDQREMTESKRIIVRRGERGFSLIEIIIVLGILGGLIAVLIGGLGTGSDNAKKKESGVRAGNVAQNLLRFQADMGRMPTTAQGLDSLINNPGSPKWSGPYGDPEDLKDGWGTPFDYELTAQGAKLVSGGPDGQTGSADDLVFLNGRLQETGGGTGEGEAAGEAQE